MELHPACTSLAFLVGTWKGPGHGEYPTIESFDYLEEVVFGHVGKPFLGYIQKTRHRDTGEPLHAEAGYLRAVGGDQVELVVVQPSGIVELHQGSVASGILDLYATGVHTTPSAKSVTEVSRSIRVNVNGDGRSVLSYDIAMAAVGQPLTHHLSAELTLQPDD